jgi:hypothetical protein
MIIKRWELVGIGAALSFSTMIVTLMVDPCVDICADVSFENIDWQLHHFLQAMFQFTLLLWVVLSISSFILFSHERWEKQKS